MSLGIEGYWVGIHDGDHRAFAIFKRHYAYRYRTGMTRGNKLFVGQGEKIVLLTQTCDALFAWQRNTTPRLDNQEGICCTIFRNEGKILSSVLIREAMELAWSRWGNRRLFTYVQPSKIKSINPGYCFKMAGWKDAGWSKGGKLILEAFPLEAKTIIEIEEIT